MIWLKQFRDGYSRKMRHADTQIDISQCDGYIVDVLCLSLQTREKIWLDRMLWVFQLWEKTSDRERRNKIGSVLKTLTTREDVVAEGEEAKVEIM